MYLRGGYVVQDQKQAVGLRVTLPVLARAHGRVNRIVDDALPIEICDYKLQIKRKKRRFGTIEKANAGTTSADG